MRKNRAVTYSVQVGPLKCPSVDFSYRVSRITDIISNKDGMVQRASNV